MCVCAVFVATLVKHYSSYRRAQMKAFPNLNGSLNRASYRELAWTMMLVIGFALGPERLAGLLRWSQTSWEEVSLSFRPFT